MECETVLFSNHAVQRMLERQIRFHDAFWTVQKGEPILEWIDEFGDLCRLLPAFPGGRPLHVAIVAHADEHTCVVATVYQPDPSQWTVDFKRRKR